MEQFEIFKGKTFADLMSDVYHNSKKKDIQIKQLIAQLQPLISTPGDATIIVPLIKEYLDISVKNDDALVKLTAIVQRYLAAEKNISSDSGGLLTDSERQELISVAKKDLESDLTGALEEMERDDDKLARKIQETKDKLNDERE